MRFLLAPDSYKECMTACEASDSMKKGILKVLDDADIIELPMADGGEGTLYSIVNANNGTIVKKEVTGPNGDKVLASFGVYKDTAVIEMAQASGLELVLNEKRNPLYSTTYGTGELIKAALDMNVKNIIITLGGSATNDAGAGMLQALGVKFLDKEGKELEKGGFALGNLEKIDMSGFDRRIHLTKITVACDVTNVLTGKDGASFVFGPQKGADKNMVQFLDKALCHFSKIAKAQFGIDLNIIKGGGAAGGMGAGIVAFMNGSIISGIECVMENVNFDDKLSGVDYIYTGEGSIDGQTVLGKTISGIAKKAKEKGIPVIAFGGRVDKESRNLYLDGVTSLINININNSPLNESLKDGRENLEFAAESITRIIKSSVSMK